MKSGAEPEHVGHPYHGPGGESSLSEAVQSSFQAIALRRDFSRTPTYHVNRGEERAGGMSQNIVFATWAGKNGFKPGFLSWACP